MTEPQATTEVPKDNETPEPTKKATNLIIVGMAGSGKTTFMQVCLMYRDQNQII